MSIKFLLLGGGEFWVFGGGECRFSFYGREDFSDLLLFPEETPHKENFRVGSYRVGFPRCFFCVFMCFFALESQHKLQSAPAEAPK